MSVFTLMFGKQTFSTTSAKVRVFHRRGPERTFPNKTLPILSSSNLPAMEGGGYRSQKINGEYTMATYDTEQSEGAILQIEFTSSFRGATVRQVALFLRVRREASFISINIQLPAHREARFNRLTVFSGNADVLTLDEVTELGIPITDWYEAAFLNPAEAQEVVEIEEMAAQRSAKPRLERVVDTTGEEKTVAIPAGQSRRIRIRRGDNG